MRVLVLSLCILAATSANATEPNYDSAIDHAQKAFLIQSGIQGFIEKAGNYAKDEIKRKGFEPEMAVSLFAYKVYKDRSVTFKASKNKTIKIDQRSINLTIAF